MVVNSGNDDKNTKPGTAGSGEQETGPEENSELEWAKQHVTDEPVPQPVRDVFRKTELHGITPEAKPDGLKKIRRRTMQSLKSPGAMVSYHSFETAFKDFICSLMERQDMMGEELLLHIADLQQQIDAFEDRLIKVNKTEPGSDLETKP
jgi:hypothetical protein